MDHAQQRGQHMLVRRVYANHFDMDADLKMLIIGVVESFFLSEQLSRYMRYLGVTEQQLVEHLIQNYDNITASIMHKNKAHMEEAIALHS